MSVTITGLLELQSALQSLTEELRAEAAGIVDSAAASAQGEIRAAYAAVASGDGYQLTDHVTRNTTQTAERVRATVTVTGDYAKAYEYGSALRTTSTGRNRGMMPARPTVVPIGRRHRERMRERLIAMVRSHGLDVSGA